MQIPETEYAWNGDVALAYQVIGEGPPDLVYMDGYASHVDINWESPYFARYLRGLAGHARLIIADRRGYGCSDRFSPTDVPPLEATVDDIMAVMEAAGSERAVIFGTWFAGFVAALFAASHPERAMALILGDAFATYAATEETPWMPTPQEWEESCELVRNGWGTPSWAAATFTKEFLETMGEAERAWHARWERASTAPGALMAELRGHMNTDIRGILPSIHVPTLVIGDTEGSGVGDAKNSRFLADRIAGARLIELPRGDQLLWYSQSDAVVREIGRFLEQVHREEAVLDRVLATVVFTDIVGSTEKAAQLGDRAWKDLVERHHSTVRALLARYRGKEMDTAGDGFFAAFDGPARAVRCAQAIIDAVLPLGIEVRAGLHTGECELIDKKVGGIAAIIGARVGGLAAPSEVLVSQTLKDLVAGAGLEFEDRGEHELKGVPDRWRLYRVVGKQPARA